MCVDSSLFLRPPIGLLLEGRASPQGAIVPRGSKSRGSPRDHELSAGASPEEPPRSGPPREAAPQLTPTLTDPHRLPPIISAVRRVQSRGTGRHNKLCGVRSHGNTTQHGVHVGKSLPYPYWRNVTRFVPPSPAHHLPYSVNVLHCACTGTDTATPPAYART